MRCKFFCDEVKMQKFNYSHPTGLANLKKIFVTGMQKKKVRLEIRNILKKSLMELLVCLFNLCAKNLAPNGLSKICRSISIKIKSLLC